MTTLNHAVGTRLEWRQPEVWRRAHELTADGESVSFWGGEWTFDSEGGGEVVTVHGPQAF